ncbi:MAG: hypothetical protein ACKVP3_10150, partial [Hyphomicrobiaceae bacterium]
ISRRAPMLICPAIGDTDPIRYRRPTPDGQFSGTIFDEAMRPPPGRDSAKPSGATLRASSLGVASLQSRGWSTSTPILVSNSTSSMLLSAEDLK